MEVGWKSKDEYIYCFIVMHFDVEKPASRRIKR